MQNRLSQSIRQNCYSDFANFTHSRITFKELSYKIGQKLQSCAKITKLLRTNFVRSLLTNTFISVRKYNIN